jgi:hypothetical protein
VIFIDIATSALWSVYASPNMIRIIKSRRIRWVGHVALTEGKKNVMMWKPEERRPLGSPRHKWEDNIIMDLKSIEWEGVDWLYMAQDRDRWWAFVNTVMNLGVP